MGVILSVACCVCCLAAVGYNSKRRKRDRENALAWDRVSETISSGGDVVTALDNVVTTGVDSGPTTKTGDTSWDSLWSNPLATMTTTTTTTTLTSFDSYQTTDPRELLLSNDEDANMWGGAAEAEEIEPRASEEFESMWPGSTKGKTEGKGKSGKRDSARPTLNTQGTDVDFGRQGKRDSARPTLNTQGTDTDFGRLGKRDSARPTLNTQGTDTDFGRQGKRDSTQGKRNSAVSRGSVVDYGSDAPVAEASSWSMTGAWDALFAVADVEGAPPLADAVASSTEPEEEEFHF